MRDQIFYSISIIVILTQVSCRTGSPALTTNAADTSFTDNTLKITHHLLFDSLNSPQIIESSTMLITDSMVSLPAYHFLRSESKFDSANFMSCSSGSLVPLRTYKISKDTLSISIYFSTQQGWFWTGKTELDQNNNLIIGQGTHIEKSGFGDGPTISRLALKIFIPENCKLNKIEYSCP